MKPPRILLAKMGLDCHDTGVVVVAQALRDAGMEVVYIGLHNSATKVFRTAVDEDVDCIGLSFLSGQHLPHVRKLSDLLKASDQYIPIVVGGIIPYDDIPRLKEIGVAEVLVPGTPTVHIVQKLSKLCQSEAKARSASDELR